jgi:phosphohistidine phosphatase
MNLFILRHGIAANPGEDGLAADLPDEKRPLTAKGKQRIWRTTEALQAMEISLDVVVSSPLLRAQHTAQIVCEAMDLRRKLVLSNHLAPKGSHRLLIAQINEWEGKFKDIMLVGHEPALSGLIALLISGGTTVAVDLKKGGLAKLEISGHLRYGQCAHLAWLLTPRQLAMMS